MLTIFVNFKILPTTSKTGLKPCTRVFIMAFHTAFNIMIPKKMMIVITIIKVHV